LGQKVKYDTLSKKEAQLIMFEQKVKYQVRRDKSSACA
jgi:hypothetical protein